MRFAGTKAWARRKPSEAASVSPSGPQPKRTARNTGRVSSRATAKATRSIACRSAPAPTSRMRPPPTAGSAGKSRGSIVARQAAKRAPVTVRRPVAASSPAGQAHPARGQLGHVLRQQPARHGHLSRCVDGGRDGGDDGELQVGCLQGEASGRSGRRLEQHGAQRRGG